MSKLCEEIKSLREPDMREALTWYPKMKNQYVPLGWRDCLFEFLLMWNGDIAAPTMVKHKRGLDSYFHADAQFGFYWMIGDYVTGERDKKYDNAPIIQEYQDGWKPAAITTRFVQGLEIKETAFAHVPGKKELDSGDDPMFLWIDFDIRKAIEVLVPEEEVTLIVQVTAQRLKYSMIAGKNSYNEEPAKPYAHLLDIAENCLIQDDGMVRLMVDGCNADEISYINKPGSNDRLKMENILRIKVKLKDGKSNIKLLIPILPVEKSDIEAEMAFGYESALREVMDFWIEETNKGIKLSIPEKLAESTFRSNLWRMSVIAEKNPVFNEYTINCGAFNYDMLCTTPACMSNVWGFDYMGHHKEADKYLEVFRCDQGKTNPPGDNYISHPGFMSSPVRYQAIKWLSEHGSIMWSVCEHFMLTRDMDFLDRWLPSLIKACEWICVQRNEAEHSGIKGLMPPAVSTDDGVVGQFVWNDGWIYKGLASVVKVLEAVGHPEAAKWRREAGNYKKKFNEVFNQACEKAPVWKDEKGKENKLIPKELVGDLRHMNRQAFYLDTGPLFLAFSGIVDADNPVFDAALKWFREGPQVKYWRFDGGHDQVPVLHHEMSSCEPCYSWNMDISFFRRDRRHFVEGLYAQLAGARTTDLFSDVETRNGVFSTNFTTPVTFHYFRDSMIYENGNTLELMRLVPNAWLKPGDILEIKDAPTYFGNMNIRTCRNEDGKEITVDIELPRRNKPEAVYLYKPAIFETVNIIVNGKPFGSQAEKIDLSEFTEKINVKFINS